MLVEVSVRGKAAVVTLSGRMTEDCAEEFDEACQQSLSVGHKHVVANLAELRYVSSMGLRSFLRVAQVLQKAGGVLMLCGMKGMVKEVFDMAHLTSFFPVFDSVDAALENIPVEG